MKLNKHLIYKCHGPGTSERNLGVLLFSPKSKPTGRVLITQTNSKIESRAAAARDGGLGWR